MIQVALEMRAEEGCTAGPSGVALAAFPVCLACASVAYFLGLHHELLAAKQLRQGVS